MKKLFLIMPSVFGCGLLSYAQESNNGKRVWARSFLNQKAPVISVEKWLTAVPDTAGKFKLIDFWATWCGPCRQFIPTLNAFQKKYGDRLTVIGITKETEAVVHKMTSPVIEYAEAIDTGGTTMKELEIKGIPHVILIDPHGIVRWEGFPLLAGNELTASVLERLLEKYK